MVEFKDADSYFEQSKLLIKARPSTTRITTKYTVPKPSTRISKRRATKKSQADPSSTSTTTTATSEPAPATPAAPKATLTLKTYDPVSGTCLKYATDKQAEVGRLILGMGRLARHSAALPEKSEEDATTAVAGATGGAGGDGTARAGTPMEGVVQEGGGAAGKAGTPSGGGGGAQQGGGGGAGAGKQGGSGGGGGGKKKGKKGKK